MSVSFIKYDYGFFIELDIQDEHGTIYPISDATTKTISFTKPDNTVITKNADFVTTGADGKIRYFVESGFLDTAGRWKVAAHVASSSYSRYTSQTWFDVK